MVLKRCSCALHAYAHPGVQNQRQQHRIPYRSCHLATNPNPFCLLPM